MKGVKSLIKLTNLNSESLNKKDLNRVISGTVYFCFCGCYFSECFGASNCDNNAANDALGLISNPLPGKVEWNYAL